MKKPSFAYILKSRLRKRNFLYEYYFKGRQVLDIGCGEGEFLMSDKANITGIDLNERAVKKLAAQGCNVVLAGATSLPFADNSFEAAYCRNVIEHLNIPEAYLLLQEAARVLKPGGRFVLCSEVPTKKFWHTFGHVKPYPPEAIIKLFRAESREEFEGLDKFEFESVFYFGDFFRNKLAYLFSVFLAYHVPIMRREYFLVLIKK